MAFAWWSMLYLARSLCVGIRWHCCSLCYCILSVVVFVLTLASLWLIPLVLLVCAFMYFVAFMSRPFVGVLATLRRGDSIDLVSAFLVIGCLHTVNFGVLVWCPFLWIALVGVVVYLCCAFVASAALCLVFLTSAFLCLHLFFSRWFFIWFSACLRRPLATSVQCSYLVSFDYGLREYLSCYYVALATLLPNAFACCSLVPNIMFSCGFLFETLWGHICAFG